MNKSPIFIHSLFRTGSTYIFNVFRRSSFNYISFQEPLHEVTLNSKEDPSRLINGFGINEMKLNRHPILKNGYFHELYEAWPAWKSFITNESIYNGYFGANENDLGIDFWKSLIKYSTKRPVFQECRTSGRIPLIRKILGGHHIYLWRNPWDQWWSYKVTSYFDTANQLIIHAPNSPQSIKLMIASLGLEVFPGKEIAGAFNFYGDHPLDSNSRYIVFYMLWCLGIREGLEHCHTIINIDRLSDSEDYRQAILLDLSSVEIHDIDFSDCNIAQGYYNESEQSYFHKLESRVHEWLIEGGWSREEIEEIKTLRKKFEPKVWSTPLNELGQTQLIEQSSRMSVAALRYENELAKENHKRIKNQQVYDALTAEFQTVKIELNNVHQSNHNHWTQLQEAKTQLQQAMDLAHTSQAQMQWAIERAEQSESALKEMSKNFAQLQEQTKAQVEQAMDLVHASQTQMQWAIGRAEQSESALKDMNNNFAQLQEQTKTQIHQAIDLAHASQAQMQWAIERAEKFEGLSVKQLSEIQNLNTLLDTMRLELQNVHQSNHHHWLELGKTRNELYDVHQSNHHHWQSADLRQKQIEAMQRSWSWRLTWPVRLAGGVVMRPMAMIKTLANQILARGLNTYQKQLTQAIAWVLVRPKLSSRINAGLMRWPHLHGHLLALARQNGVVYPPLNRLEFDNNGTDDFGAASATLVKLSPRASQIYSDLKTAIAQQHKGQN
jgi:hypothetical protein